MSIDRQRLVELAARAGYWHGRYHNIEPTPHRGLKDFYQWRREAGWRFRDGLTYPLLKPDAALLATPGPKPRLTWIGHASFLFQYANINLLTDPMFSERCSPLGFMGPKRWTPSALTVEELPPIQLVLISHNHYDHLDHATIMALHRRFGEAVQFLVPAGVKPWFLKRGIQRVVELNWWQAIALPDAEAFFLPTQHFSGRTPRDANTTLWGSWWLKLGDFSLYFAGDTGYGEVFKTIHAVMGVPDLALLPIGAYEPRWFMREVHVDPFDAVQIHRDLDARQSVAMHWGTFVLTDEPMDEPPQKLAQALAQAGIAADRFVVMQHGESRTMSLS